MTIIWWNAKMTWKRQIDRQTNCTNRLFCVFPQFEFRVFFFDESMFSDDHFCSSLPRTSCSEPIDSDFHSSIRRPIDWPHQDMALRTREVEVIKAQNGNYTVRGLWLKNWYNSEDELENLANSFSTIFFKEWRRFVSKMQSSPNHFGTATCICCDNEMSWVKMLCAILINVVMTWAIDNRVRVRIRRNSGKSRLCYHDIYWNNSRHNDKYELSFGKNPIQPLIFKSRTNQVFSGRQATGDGQVWQRLSRAIRIGQRWAPNSWSVWNSHNFATCRNSMWS